MRLLMLVLLTGICFAQITLTEIGSASDDLGRTLSLTRSEGSGNLIISVGSPDSEVESAAAIAPVVARQLVNALQSFSEIRSGLARGQSKTVLLKTSDSNSRMTVIIDKGDSSAVCVTQGRLMRFYGITDPASRDRLAKLFSKVTGQKIKQSPRGPSLPSAPSYPTH